MQFGIWRATILPLIEKSGTSADDHPSEHRDYPVHGMERGKVENTCDWFDLNRSKGRQDRSHRRDPGGSGTKPGQGRSNGRTCDDEGSHCHRSRVRDIDSLAEIEDVSSEDDRACDGTDKADRYPFPRSEEAQSISFAPARKRSLRRQVLEHQQGRRMEDEFDPDDVDR